MSVSILGTLEEWKAAAQVYVDASVKAAVKDQIAAVVSTAKELAPVGEGTIQADHVAKYGFHPGLLRDSIVGVAAKDGMSGIVKVPEKAMTDPYYAHIVHFGSEKMEARPFLYQASERHSAEFQQKIQSNLDSKAPE